MKPKFPLLFVKMCMMSHAPVYFKVIATISGDTLQQTTKLVILINDFFPADS